MPLSGVYGNNFKIEAYSIYQHGQLLPCYLRDLIMLKSVITPPYLRLGRSHLMTHLAKPVTVWSSWLLFMVMNRNEGNMSALVTDSLPGARQSI